MATLRDQIRIVLEGDATLMALLTGGVLDASILPQDGGGGGSLPRDVNGVMVLPFAVIRWRGATRTEIVKSSSRRFFEVYFYQDTGYATIELAKARVEELLDGQRWNVDDVLMAEIRYVNDFGEGMADEFDGIPFDFSRFYVNYRRY